MSFRSVGWLAILAGIALAGAGLPGTAARAAAQKNMVSRELAKPLLAAQKDLQDARKSNTAGDKAAAQKSWQDALTHLQQADANPKKTPYDQHVINFMSAQAYLGLGDNANAAKDFEAVVNDGFLEQSQEQSLVRAVSQLNYNLKNYDKAIEYGTRALDGGFGDDQTPAVVGQAYYLKGDWPGTAKFESGYTASVVKKGQTPAKIPLQLWLNACIKMNDASCQTDALQQLVTYHPSPEYWGDLLGEVSRNATGDKSKLQVYRLMLDVDAMKTPGEYTEAAQLALEEGSPGEAQTILQKGLSSNVYSDPREAADARSLLAQAKRRATGDLASLPALDREADRAATGKAAYAVGYAYYGYQQYDKAIDDLTKGLAKGGLMDDEPAARLLLGIAQLKGGHKDEALQSFQQVKGDPLLEKLAALWVLHAKQSVAS